jgi:hypothetical protein
MSHEVLEDAQARRAGLFRLDIGALQAAGLFVLHRSWDAKGGWPHAHPALFWALVAVFALPPLVALSGLTSLRRRALAIWTPGAALACAGLAAYDILRQAPGQTPALSPQVVFATIAALFIAHHLVVGADQARRPIAPYPLYFDIAWKDAVQLALSLLFVGVFWLILWLGAALFKLIGIEGFQTLIQKDWFAYPATALVFAGAVHITDVRVGLIRGVRTVALALLAWLMPLMGLIAIAFLLALPFTGLKPLWDTRSAASVLLAAAAALIVLINAAYQDGAAEGGTPRVLAWAGRAAAVVISPIIVLAAYALALRTRQYGWTPDRIVAVACVLVGACYAVGYLLAAVRRGAWLKLLERTNVITAFVVLAVIAALFSPLFDPGRISSADQVRRLESGQIRVDRFDFNFLRFEAGRFGVDALTRLTHAKTPAIAEAARKALARKTRYEAPVLGAGELARRITAYPAGRAVPQSLLAQTWEAPVGACLTYEPKCDAYFADLDGDGREEVLLGSGVQLWVYRLGDDGVWVEVGSLMGADCAVVPALRRGEGKAVPTAWRDLEVAGARLHLNRYWRPGLEPQTACPKS